MANDPPKPASDVTAPASPRERARLGPPAALLLAAMAIGGAFIGFYKANESAELARQAEATTKVSRDEVAAATARENATKQLLATARDFCPSNRSHPI